MSEIFILKEVKYVIYRVTGRIMLSRKILSSQEISCTIKTISARNGKNEKGLAKRGKFIWASLS